MQHPKSDTLLNDPKLSHADSLVRQFEQLLERKQGDVRKISELGGGLARIGRAREARVCYDLVVAALRDYARANNVTRALECELFLYQDFVKAVEDEEHYQRCFSDWTDDLAALGRRFSDGAAPPQDADRIAFFLQNGHLLGHTEVLLKLLESRRRAGADRVEPLVYVFGPSDRVFLERCRAIGIEVVPVPVKTGPGARMRIEHKFAWLRERFRHDRIRACVWVSAAPLATFAYAARIAPVQIFWSLRFHPLAGPHIDGYITYGPEHECERSFGGQKWRVCPVPLTLDSTKLRGTAVAARLRAQFPETFLMGTVAREEKIHSKPFLKAVASILKSNPGAGYVWTGKSRHPGIQAFFDAHGVAERCHFVGWVDTALYASALDLFLESFPLGCGITGYQALGAGTPFLSYLAENTVFGMQFGAHAGAVPDTAAEDAPPVLCARSPEEYVRLAGRLAAEPDFRQSVGSRGQAFFEHEMGKAALYSRRFFDTIAAIAGEDTG